MPVSSEIRKVEDEIDSKIPAMPLWSGKRATVLEALMGTYRDAVELSHIYSLHGDYDKGLISEDRWRNGAFWALKWATRYCPESGSEEPIDSEDMVGAIQLGEIYDSWVDVLKQAKHGLVSLSVNCVDKEILCHEGHDVTGFDAEIVEHQQAMGPTQAQESLTVDSDQIASKWSAGDYRRVVQELASFASVQENYTAAKIPQPTLVWLDRPGAEPDSCVFDSLTLPTRLGGKDEFMWRARSLLETPIVNCAGRFCALSSDLKTIALIDDYMLRLAARIDRKQYSRVSGRREDRMVAACRRAFTESGTAWAVQSHVKLAEPPQEIDVIACRPGERIAIELKSTLRPETAWEVHNRNGDILKGISQMKDIVENGIAERAFVITDGYWGNYACWAEALKHGVAIGTLRDLDDLARDPEEAVGLMKARAGVPVDEHAVPRLPDREGNILGWTLRLIDAEN